MFKFTKTTFTGPQCPGIESSAVIPEDVTAAIAEFARTVRVVRRRAGDPPFRTLARTTSYSVSTITRALGGQKLPKWPVVDELLDAFRADDSARAAVKKSWCAAAERLAPIGVEPDIPEPGTTGGPTSGHECSTGGAWVLDEQRHRLWHAEYVPREPNSLRVVRRSDEAAPRRRNISG